MNIKDITHFNDTVFPIRKPHDEYDAYRLLENPFGNKTELPVYQEYQDGNYIAQMITMPAPLIYQNNEIPAFWGQDYFVLEAYRGKGIGKSLAPKYLGKDYYIAVGFSPKSEIIHRKMGAHPIGYLDSFEKWISPKKHLFFYIHRLLKIKNKKISEYSFPDDIQVINSLFTRVKSIDNLHLPKKQWNENCIESLRNKAYFQWRFFYLPDKYFVYQKKASNPTKNASYIVVKPYFYKGVNWLKVVDFRFDFQHKEDFSQMLDLAEMLCKNLNLYGICISSSLKSACEILKAKNYIQKSHRVVLTTYPFPHTSQEANDEMTDNLCINISDSDLDMHDNLGKFVYQKK